MKKYIINIIITLIIVIWIMIWFFYIKNINYLNHVIISNKEAQERNYIKNKKLKREIILYSKVFNYRKLINLSSFKDYFILNWNYCDIDNSFFVWINKELDEKNIIFKPKIINIFTDKIEYVNLGKKIKLENLKRKICNYVLSENSNMEYIDIEIESYKYEEDLEIELKNYKEIWKYKIKKYLKIPKESVKNSEIIINKISNEIIFPWETISFLEKLLNKWWKDLLDSNILENWEIIKWIWGGSCLASSIIYRTLLDWGIDIISQKAHNIYYENIYWIDEIWLDSTIFENEKYFIDLIFKNNYKDPIIFIPNYSDDKIELTLYWKEKEFYTKLQAIELENKDKINWKYEIFDLNNNKIFERNLESKYDKIDDY